MKRCVLTILTCAALMLASSALAVNVKQMDETKKKSAETAKPGETKDKPEAKSTDKAPSAAKSQPKKETDSGVLEKLNILRRQVKESKSSDRGARKYDYFQDANRDGVGDNAPKAPPTVKDKDTGRKKAEPAAEPKKATKKKSPDPDRSTAGVKKKRR